MLSIAHGLPTHLDDLDDPAIGRFGCPYKHTKPEITKFRYESDCIDHMNTHKDVKEKLPPIDRTNNAQDFGVFTCGMCKGEEEFRTDKQKFAANHLGSFHLLHSPSIFGQDIPKKGGLAKYLTTSFVVNGDKALASKGQFTCLLDRLKFTKTIKTMQHLASKFHQKDVEKMENAGLGEYEEKGIPREDLKDFITGFNQRWSGDNAKKSTNSFTAAELKAFNFHKLVEHVLAPAPGPVNPPTRFYWSLTEYATTIPNVRNEFETFPLQNVYHLTEDEAYRWLINQRPVLNSLEYSLYELVVRIRKRYRNDADFKNALLTNETIRFAISAYFKLNPDYN